MSNIRLWKKPDGFLIYAILYLTFIYLPVLFLPLFSFNNSNYITFPLKDFTLKWYDKMIHSPSMLEALLNSIKVGLLVAIFSTILGMLAARAVTRYRLRGRGPLVSFIMIPLVIPEIILAISLLILISQANIPLSLWTIGFSHLLLCIPFSMLILISRMEGFDKSLEEAALDLGENAWITFWRVTFPIVLPGIVASLLLTFTISFDEFVLAFFLSSTDATLPIYIWSSLRFPTKIPAVLALGSSIFVISFFVVSFAEWVRRRGIKLETTSGI
ncbi:MAG TPA: ABC transporter permease [Candidatus Lambdaproteobacteria bacterium]|jgi:spermidine/putrescine transport system permease protein|nr:ABC transporter permease [Nitrospinaceae bacterium]HIB17061.1 ABC transporter permease [Candidatus Lambdaproteobacteria bacterium]HIO61894.1 ABC transporter permease [Deltaproteobacteria bacterium]|tara:strand:+ start:2436 stop:3251 length:816 start_codon:yes stop_codon:yes gene_type:complete